MRNRIILYIFIIVISIAIGLSPVTKWVYDYFNPANRSGLSRLIFSTTEGEYKIYLNNTVLGETTNTEKTKIFNTINPGQNTLKIERKSDNNFYFTFIKEITFLPATEVSISWVSGPTLESSSGVIKYFVLNQEDTATVEFITFPSNSMIVNDEKQLPEKTIKVSDGNKRVYTISNGQGFETKEVEISLTTDESNKTIKEFKLIVEVYLYKQPFF